MLILALDAAMDACTAALCRDGAVAAADSAPMRRGQAEALLPMVARVCAAAGAAPDDLDGIAVAVGPGGFTGIRIGVAAARGLALALGRPAIGIATTEAIAAAQPPGDGPLLAAVETKRADLYGALFPEGWAPAAAGDPATAPFAVAPEALGDRLGPAGPEPLRIAGDAAARAGAALAAVGRAWRPAGGPAIATPEALCRVAAARFAQALAAGETPPPPSPLYLRPPDARLPAGGPAK